MVLIFKTWLNRNIPASIRHLCNLVLPNTNPTHSYIPPPQVRCPGITYEYDVFVDGKFVRVRERPLTDIEKKISQEKILDRLNKTTPK